MATIAIKALNHRLEQMVRFLTKTYTLCEDCECRKEGCNCPAQDYLDEIFEDLK